MDEIFQQEEDRRNDSGAEMYEYMEWYERNRYLLNCHAEVRKEIEAGISEGFRNIFQGARNEHT